MTEDGRGVAQNLAGLLNAAGANASVCATPSADARSVIDLTGLRPFDTPQEAAQISAAGFRIAADLGATLEADGGLLITVQDTGGDHGLHGQEEPLGKLAWLGGFSGLAKTAAQEWPKAVVRSIDIASQAGDDEQPYPAAEVAQRLATEILNGGRDVEIGLPADGRRLAFVSKPTAVDAGSRAAAVDANSVIVVSGGARGVTAAAIIKLAQQSPAKFALLGRSPLTEEPAFLQGCADDASLKKALLADAMANGQKLTPRELGSAASRVLAAREIRQTLADLSAAGAEGRYIPCDVTDTESTAAALQSVRDAWGPITGIVHGAGVLADKRLAEKTPEDFQRVFNTKVLGLHALLSATQSDPLTLLCLFSSVAGRAGNAGQADYAMANEVLNRVAQAEAQRRNMAQRAPSCIVKSIGWGPWEGGMVTPLLKAKFEEMGVELIPLDGGTRSFVDEVQHASAEQVDVVIGGGAPQNAPLLGNGQSPLAAPLIYDIVVNEVTCPYLWSHQINGVVVLPLVAVQEWFLRAAAALSDQPFRGRCQKLSVLKGIPLPNFGQESTRLRITLTPDADTPDAGTPATIKAVLTDASGTPRYSAQLLLDEAATAINPIPAAAPDWAEVELTGADLYETTLFHGPDFAALQRIHRMGQSGAEATLIGSHALGWVSDEWATALWASDPALLDGGLQVAQIWGLEQLQALTLPASIREFVLHKPSFHLSAAETGSQVRLLLQGQVIGSLGIRCDLWFVDQASGELIAEMRGLEMYTYNEI